MNPIIASSSAGSASAAERAASSARLASSSVSATVTSMRNNTFTSCARRPCATALSRTYSRYSLISSGVFT